MSEDSVKDAEYWKSDGNSLYKVGNYKGAINSYNNAIELERTSAALFTNRAAASLMLLQYKEALSDCDQALFLDKNNSKAYFRKATALKGLGMLQEALTSLEEGLQCDPTSAAAKQDKKQLEEAQISIIQLEDIVKAKRYKVALPQIDKLISVIGPNFRVLTFLRAECLLGLNRPEDAYNLTNTMMKTATNGDVELLTLRARIFYVMGDTDNALKHLQQAARADPDSAPTRIFYRKVRDMLEAKKMGDDYFKAGDNEAAITSWTSAIELGIDNRSFVSKLYLNRAIAKAKMENYADSVKDCSSAIKHDSGYVKAYLRRADSYLAMGGPEHIQAAVSDFEALLEIETDEQNMNGIKSKLKKAKVALKRSKKKDLYALLGTHSGASDAEIKSAYRKSALKYHPDRHTGKSDEEKSAAETMFKTVNEAYEILSNADKREQYDQGVEVEDMDNGDGAGHGHGGGFGGGHSGIDPSMLFHMFMQQQHGGR